MSDKRIEVRHNGVPFFVGQWQWKGSDGGTFTGTELSTGREYTTGMAMRVAGRTFHEVDA